jgi:metal-responsive CopG/Arc/MetJ family transcriptional regulator
MANPIAIRLSDEVLARIDNVVETAHLGDRTAVIKLCLLSFLSHYETQGRSVLPLDWNNILQTLEKTAAKNK